MQILKEFNELLSRNTTYRVGVGVKENKVVFVIQPKSTVEEFEATIIKAIEEEEDTNSVELTHAESFDYGYAIELHYTYMDDSTEQYKSSVTLNLSVLY